MSIERSDNSPHFEHLSVSKENALTLLGLYFNELKNSDRDAWENFVANGSVALMHSRDKVYLQKLNEIIVTEAAHFYAVDAITCDFGGEELLEIADKIAIEIRKQFQYPPSKEVEPAQNIVKPKKFVEKLRELYDLSTLTDQGGVFLTELKNGSTTLAVNALKQLSQEHAYKNFVTLGMSEKERIAHMRSLYFLLAPVEHSI